MCQLWPIDGLTMVKLISTIVIVHFANTFSNSHSLLIPSGNFTKLNIKNGQRNTVVRFPMNSTVNFHSNVQLPEICFHVYPKGSPSTMARLLTEVDVPIKHCDCSFPNC